MVNFLPRHIKPRLLEALKNSPIIFLNGARQTGKSTLVNNLLPATYVTFDRPTVMAAASAAPEAFLAGYPKPLIIDEVQMVPELFRALKLVVDEERRSPHKQANGNYLLTGSANILALPKLADPLVGRMQILTLYPFTAAEANQGNGNGLKQLLEKDMTGVTNQELSLVDAIKKATFPETIAMDNKTRGAWFDSYITTLIQRDVKQIAELEKSYLLPQLLRILATRAGGLLNDSDIAREIGLTSPTAKTYRHILQMMFLTFDVRPWYRNIGKRLVKAPKGYIIDTNLLCHMLDLNIDEVAAGNPILFGHILENYVATELVKQLGNGNIKASLYHFRTGDGREVDFVIEKPDGSVFAIEVKRSETVTMDDFKGIKEFQAITGKDFTGGVVLYSGKEPVPFGKDLWAVPLSVLWK